MGHLRNATPADKHSFPGCTYAITNSVPNTQCQETLTTVLAPWWIIGQTWIDIWPHTLDIWLVGKDCTVVNSPLDDGIYAILDQEGDLIFTSHTFIGNVAAAQLFIADPGHAYLTRNQRSFSKFIDAQCHAQTYKGGILYTDTPNPPMSEACSDLFNPT